MEIKTYSKENVNIIKISGKLNVANLEPVQNKIENLTYKGCKLIFDLTDCIYVSNSGLRTLLVAAKQLEVIGGKGVIVGLSEEIKDILEITGFSTILRSYGTLFEAFEEIKKEVKAC